MGAEPQGQNPDPLTLAQENFLLLFDLHLIRYNNWIIRCREKFGMPDRGEYQFDRNESLDKWVAAINQLRHGRTLTYNGFTVPDPP